MIHWDTSYAYLKLTYMDKHGNIHGQFYGKKIKVVKKWSN